MRGRRAAIPNPVTEGIGALFRDLYNEYCGDYPDFVSRNSVVITKIHYREIPQLFTRYRGGGVIRPRRPGTGGSTT